MPDQKAINLIQITDTHLLACKKDKFKEINPFQSLKDTLKHIELSNWQPDLVIATGDLSQDGSTTSYEHFFRLLQHSAIPILCIPGNHDKKDKLIKSLSGKSFYCEQITKRNWSIIGIDSCYKDGTSGYISKRELKRLKSSLNNSNSEHIIICLHHQPVSIESEWLDKIGLQNNTEFLNLIKTSPKVRAVFFGHIHQDYVSDLNGIKMIGTPSTCKQFKSKENDFVLDNLPPAYRRIELYDGGSIQSEIIWLQTFN